MATYAIGDIHGAYWPFRRLLEGLGFDPVHDRLWLVGDLVNRGPDSLATLRFVRELGDAAITVLGNHDLNLLALAQRKDVRLRANASLQPLLAAPDCEALLDWLRHRPLLHRDRALGWTMVHAGVAAEWDLATAEALAAEAETALRGADYPAVLAAMYGNEPSRWQPDLDGSRRLRFIVNCLTRMRFCQPDGALDLDYKKTIEDAPARLVPWFALPGRRSASEHIVFGHWSALSQVAWPQYRVWGIDSGCAWGGCLTALRLDGDREILQLPCDDGDNL